jgi:hypothetical protein
LIFSICRRFPLSRLPLSLPLSLHAPATFRLRVVVRPFLRFTPQTVDGANQALKIVHEVIGCDFKCVPPGELAD